MGSYMPFLGKLSLYLMLLSSSASLFPSSNCCILQVICLWMQSIRSYFSCQGYMYVASSNAAVTTAGYCNGASHTAII